MNLRTPAAVALSGTLLLLQPYRPFVVDGDSMSPTLASGQWLIGDARPHQIARGDVVVFRRGSETMIKRVALLPGDRIERYHFLGEWKIPVNMMMRNAMVRQRMRRSDLTVPEDRLYVLGDNLAQSVDSRTYGTIPLHDVIAVVPRVGPSEQAWTAPDHLTRTLAAAL